MHCISECGVLERYKHNGYFKVDSSENLFMFFCYMHCFFDDDTLQYSALVPLFMVTYQINTVNSKLRKKQVIFLVFIMTVLSQFETTWQFFFIMKTRGIFIDIT